MKHKAPRASPIPRLYDAVREIVAGARRAFHESGNGNDPEMRLPVLFKGTDMRCTIEAGPSVASRNAIEHAQMSASGRPVAMDRDDALREAMALLAQYASEVRTSESDCEGRIGNPESQRLVDRCVNCVRALDSMRGGQTNDRAARSAPR